MNAPGKICFKQPRSLDRDNVDVLAYLLPVTRYITTFSCPRSINSAQMSISCKCIPLVRMVLFLFLPLWPTLPLPVELLSLDLMLERFTCYSVSPSRPRDSGCMFILISASPAATLCHLITFQIVSSEPSIYPGKCSVFTVNTFDYEII